MPAEDFCQYLFTHFNAMMQAMRTFSTDNTIMTGDGMTISKPGLT